MPREILRCRIHQAFFAKVITAPPKSHPLNSHSTLFVMTNNLDHPFSYIHDFKGKVVVVDKSYSHPRIQLQLGDIISQDTSGVFRRAHDVNKPESAYAVKCISLRNMTRNQLLCMSHEIDLHERCSAASDNVVQFHGVYRDEVNKMVYVAMELCEDGNLLDYILKEQRMRSCDSVKEEKDRTQKIKDILSQILNAVDACHTIGVYHRNLNPENIFVMNDGRIVVGKFGYATTKKMSYDFHLGSRAYKSPEVCRGIPGQGGGCISSSHADVWALGVIFANLISCCLPWEKASMTEETFSEYVNSGNLPYDRIPITYDADKILKSTFRINASERISITDLRKLVLKAETFGPGRWEDVPSESRGRYIDYSANDDTNATTLPHAPAIEPESECDTEAESEDESEGPITPETHAVDVPIIVTSTAAGSALENLDNMSELSLPDASPVKQMGRAEQMRAVLELRLRKNNASTSPSVRRETPVYDDSWLHAKRVEKPYKEWNKDVIMRLYRAIKL